MEPPPFPPIDAGISVTHYCIKRPANIKPVSRYDDSIVIPCLAKGGAMC